MVNDLYFFMVSSTKQGYILLNWASVIVLFTDPTHIVSLCEDLCKCSIHVVVVTGHEGCVDQNAQRDEQVHKGIHNEDLHIVCKLVPAGRALKHRYPCIKSQIRAHKLRTELYNIITGIHVLNLRSEHTNSGQSSIT